MRRLAFITRALVLGVAVSSTAARAEDKVEVKAEYFAEPGTQSLNVFHPSVAGNIDAHRDFSINLGYEADIVSGATPGGCGALP